MPSFGQPKAPPKTSTEARQLPSFKHPMPPMKTSAELKPSRPAILSHGFKPSQSHTVSAPKMTEHQQTWMDWSTTTQTQTWNYTFTHNHTWTMTATGSCPTTTLTQNSTITTVSTMTSTSPTTSPSTSAPQAQQTWFPLMARVARQDSILGANFLRSVYTFVDLDGRRVYLGQAASGGSRPNLRSVPFDNAQEEQKFFNPPLNAAIPSQLAQQQEPSLGVATVSTTATLTEPDATVTVVADDGKATRIIVFDGTSVVETLTPTTETSTATTVESEEPAKTSSQGTRHYLEWSTATVIGLSMLMVMIAM